MTDYLKKYCRGVKPRYYKAQGVFIITYSKDIFKLTIKHLKKNNKKYIAIKQNNKYIVKEII